jgi:hypothetical protein
MPKVARWRLGAQEQRSIKLRISLPPRSRACNVALSVVVQIRSGLEMQKARHDKTHKRAPASWLSTARSAMRFVRSSEQLFSPRDGESAEPRERLVENFQEAVQQFVRANDQNEPLARPDLSTGPKNTACNWTSTQARSRTGLDRVVLFAPGPVTQADLLKENSRRAVAIRHRHRRRRRYGWVSDNAGIIAAVAVIFVLAWFIAAR